MKKYRLAFMVLLLSGMAQSPLFAGVSLNKTRLIIPEISRESGVRVLNEGKSPVLIQSWIDAGDSNLRPEEIVAPLIITTPMFRLEAGAAQLMRILLIAKPAQLPTDQESVFWLNVQEIPQQLALEPQDNNEQYIQIAFRTRIKIFYRPQKISTDPNLLHQQLRFTLVEQDGKTFLQAQNPTPIHITLQQVLLGTNREDPAAVGVLTDGMVGTQSTRLIPLRDIRHTLNKETLVYYQVLDDYGQSIERQQNLSDTE